MSLARLPRDIWRLVRDTAVAWDADNCWRLGAALSYFTVFSLSPLLMIVVVVSSLGFGEDAAQGHLDSEIRGLIGDEGARFVQSMVENAYESGASVPAAVFGLVTLILGATGVFVQLLGSLNTIWRVEHKPIGTIAGFLRTRFLSFAMILCIGFLLLVSLILSAVMAAFSQYLSNSFTFLAGVVSVIDFILSFAVITVMFAFMFKFLPDAVVQWRDVWVGATVTSLLFSLGKVGIGLYLGNSVVGSTFGAASSLVIIMLWTFYSAEIVLFGAEFTRVFAGQFGSKIVPARNAVRVITRKVELNPVGRKKVAPEPEERE